MVPSQLQSILVSPAVQRELVHHITKTLFKPQPDRQGFKSIMGFVRALKLSIAGLTTLLLVRLHETSSGMLNIPLYIATISYATVIILTALTKFQDWGVYKDEFSFTRLITFHVFYNLMNLVGFIALLQLPTRTDAIVSHAILNFPLTLLWLMWLIPNVVYGFGACFKQHWEQLSFHEQLALQSHWLGRWLTSTLGLRLGEYKTTL